jgi:hypothetical protein
MRAVSFTPPDAAVFYFINREGEQAMRRIYILLSALVWALPAAAQQQPGAAGGVVIESEPGKAVIERAVQISAQVVAINKATRVVTLKGPRGKVVDVLAGDEVKNFAQIEVGDFVMVRYMESLSLQLKKTKSGASGVSGREAQMRAKPGERPAAAAVREVTAIAKVTAIDEKAKTITLKGPKGEELMLGVRNPDQFKVVKVGDEVEVHYTQAAAISVEPVPDAGAAKK